MVKPLNKSWLLPMMLTMVCSSARSASSENISTTTIANASQSITTLLTSSYHVTANTSSVHNDIVSSSTNMTSTTPKTTSITTSESTSISSEQTTTGSSDILPITTVATPSGSTTSTSGLQNSTTSAILTNQTETSVTSNSITTSSTAEVETTKTKTRIDYCKQLDNSTNLIIANHSTSFNSTVNFSCAQGYQLQGNSSATCLEYGNWSVEQPECELINCKQLDNSTSLIIANHSTSFNSTVNFSCAKGYQLLGNSSATCLEYGNWSVEQPECDLINCKQLDNSTNLIIANHSTSFNSTVNFSCAKGYQLLGNSSATCLEYGNWSVEQPKCELINCKQLDNLTNLIIANHSTSFNSTVNFSCAKGYQLLGNSSATCLEYGNWSVEQPECDLIIPSRPSNGFISNVTEYTFAANWTDENPQSYIYYDVIIPTGATIDPYFNKTNATLYRLSSNMSPIVISGLVAGNEYNISIYTVAVFEGSSAQRSETALILETYTVPLAPQNVTLPEDGRKNNSFLINLQDPNPDFTNWTIEVIENETNKTVYNKTYKTSNTNKNVEVGTNFTSGTLYRAVISTSVPGYSSRNKTTKRFFTRPSDPAMMTVTDEFISTEGFVLNVQANDLNFDHYFLRVCSGSNETCFEQNKTSNEQEDQVNVTGLTSGTQYNCTLYTVLENGFKSYTPKNISIYTRPNYPKSVTNSTIHERNVTINVTTGDDRFESFLVYVNDKLIFQNTSEHVHNISNLEPATLYKVTVYTVIGNNLTSRESKSLCFTTRPKTPDNGSVSEVGLNKIGLKFSRPPNEFESFYVQYKEANKTCNFYVVNNDIENHEQVYIKDNLTAGTLYTFEVYTYFQGLLSDDNGWIISYTKPEQINNLIVSNTTNTSLLLKWDPPNKGNVDKYTISYECIGPNNGFDIISNESIVPFPTQNTTLSGLNPGTFCNASVLTAVGDQEGYPKREVLTPSTAEEGPDVVEAENIANIGSRNIDIQWKRPSKRNGLITKYEISASLNGTSVDTGILNCTVCTMEKNVSNLQRFVNECASALSCDNSISTDSLYYNFTNLHPFRTYTFTITAFTHEKGKRKTMTGKTKEDKPDGPPQNITFFSDTFMLTLDWEPPSFDVRNGIITNYTVEYSFFNKPCYNSEDGGDEHMNQTLGNQTKTNLHNLFPFTDYQIQIKASTSVGYGNYSDIITVRTNQSVPSKIDINRITNTVTSKSITLKWETPCRPNGIITNYTIQIKNTNPSDEQPDSTKITSSNETTETIEGLMPYRNYTISISGNTIAGANNDSDTFKLTTNISKPKTPKHLRVEATSSKELSVTWDKPTLKMYTGPTHYVVVAEDDRTKKEVHRKKVYGFENNNCAVEELDEYWNYTVTVTAITDAGNATSASKGGRTEEDVPLEVASVELKPQPNVTLKRSIFVRWTPPIERNQNGIITNYFVEYSSKPLERREVFKLPPALKNFTIVNISPGNYIVTVYAATAVGNGTESNKSTELLPGAPLKVPETNENPLMRAGTFQVSNNKKEIPVELPTDSFLCNISNGDNIEWGVVVAQDSEATDTPFNGNKADFEKKKEEMYKTWSIVKEKESIPPYIATPSTWNPCSVGSGTRRRRSTDQRIKTFTVGEDGDCTGRCNGPLQPGRNYRVKSYVCTQEGCTETLYSEPIATETSFEEVVALSYTCIKPDPTIPIVAGVVSALVVISVAGVIVFFLKRRQVACFSKDVETTTTHRAGNEITLDKIEPKQPNAFRPGPIKLADFPQAVEKMHRDSDLLFADAYKPLVEKSPSHPLTAAEQQCSRPKNRYTNILPFDHSRVKLRPSDDIEGSDYINANYIPGYSSRREYIATQGPMQATFDDFWRMVWEQNVDTVVMLTKLMEKGRRKCDKYWPDIGEPVFYGDLVVSLQSESNLSDYTIKIFEVKMNEERKVITHFSYLKWPDMGCPETPELLLDFVKAVRQYTNRDKKQSPGPIIVHCSAGVGRTGTFIAVDYLLQHIRDHDDVDIYNLVLEMRNHRLNMVQTEDQYVYIHECLKAFITTDEEEEDEDEEPVYMNTDKEDKYIYVNTAFTKE